MNANIPIIVAMAMVSWILFWMAQQQ